MSALFIVCLLAGQLGVLLVISTVLAEIRDLLRGGGR